MVDVIKDLVYSIIHHVYRSEQTNVLLTNRQVAMIDYTVLLENTLMSSYKCPASLGDSTKLKLQLKVRRGNVLNICVHLCEIRKSKI